MSRNTSFASDDWGSDSDGLCGKAAVACLKNRAGLLISGEHYENQRPASGADYEVNSTSKCTTEDLMEHLMRRLVV